ncbi:uncharacterized protein METZ01_LOCUS472508, partial [marine metagenome]
YTQTYYTVVLLFWGFTYDIENQKRSTTV